MVEVPFDFCRQLISLAQLDRGSHLAPGLIHEYPEDRDWHYIPFLHFRSLRWNAFHVKPICQSGLIPLPPGPCRGLPCRLPFQTVISCHGQQALSKNSGVGQDGPLRIRATKEPFRGPLKLRKRTAPGSIVDSLRFRLKTRLISV